MTADDAEAAIRQAAARIAALGESGPRPGPDPVNLPMIRHWVQAMGDTNPVYTDAGAGARSVHGGLVAPPAMTQVWTMRGLRPASSEDPGDPLGRMSAALDEAGYTSVVATNSEQEYFRYLRLGEQLTVRSSLEEVTGPKRTALGEGWFVTTRSTWYVGTEAVASMKFRILKFRPAGPGPEEPSAPAASVLRLVTQEPGEPPEPDGPPGPGELAGPPEPAGAAAGVLRPVVSPDTAFFWEGTARHELRIQRCGGCGTLRHPPGPMCPVCGIARREYDVAAGTGEVYSYVVHHHPPVPGRQLPIVIALVQLTEGVRMVGELLDADPERIRIGLPVRVTFAEVDGELTLPAWREDQR
ncbi:MAG TPA: bifunctional MaoC family dehydratase N-terminal/OB-fold nucleic acid binding domain-containing protein [Streptosporangiaceae bacterium]|nr:bifunctional MaoC family dehydratase N-terminal/OB-fold nucleic acid binding domain-containing protein [Streptosporangiaceae bacterium]